VLSGDRAMVEAYSSGDPYLAFGKQAGAIPADATKQTHGGQRELFKQCVLAVQYGMGAESLADRIGQPVVMANALLRAHRETYKVFWQWSDRVVDCAALRGSLVTVFGWKVRTLRSDAKVIRYPDRYSDPRGEVMWSKVMELVGEKQL
jgi:DNA polymerase-1